MNEFRAYLLELLDEENYNYRNCIKYGLMEMMHESSGAKKMLERILTHIETEINNDLIKMNRIEQIKIDPNDGLINNLNKLTGSDK